MIVDKDAEALGSEVGEMQVGSGGGEIGVGDGGVVREFVGERITELRGHESRIFCAEWDPTGEISPSSVPPVSMSPSECGLHHGMPADRRWKLCKQSSCLQLSYSMLSLPLFLHQSISLSLSFPSAFSTMLRQS